MQAQPLPFIAMCGSHRAGDMIELAAVPGLQVAVAELIPQRR